MMASPFLYGCHYAWMLSVFAVVMVYSVACPLIMPIGQPALVSDIMTATRYSSTVMFDVYAKITFNKNTNIY